MTEIVNAMLTEIMEIASLIAKIITTVDMPVREELETRASKMKTATPRSKWLSTEPVIPRSLFNIKECITMKAVFYPLSSLTNMAVVLTPR